MAESLEVCGTGMQPSLNHREPHSTPSSSNRVPPENHPVLRDLLQQMLRVQLQDGRVLVGRFICTDADCNVILIDCEQTLPDSNEEPIHTGMAMVPGDHIVSISKEATQGSWTNHHMKDVTHDLSEVSLDQPAT